MKLEEIAKIAERVKKQLHVYRKGYGNKWAIRDISNVRVTYNDFLQFCNITQAPCVHWGLFS